MKKLFCLLAVLWLSGVMSVAMAQRGMIDVVYLKNGSMIRGVIVEQVPGESIKIETAEGNLFVYRLDEINKMTREEAYGYSRRRSAPQQAGASSRRTASLRPEAYWGYGGITEAGYAIGVGRMEGGAATLSVINGYQMGNYFYAGLGVGVNYTTSAGSVLMPVFAHFRSRPLSTKVSPYAAFSVGYSVALSNANGGLYYEPSLGVSFRLRGRQSLTFGVGYMVSQGRYWDWGNYEKFTLSLGAVSLRVGFTF